jgi:hypothetical protein
MKLLVFSVFDSKAEVYGTPIFFPTKGLATRAFEDQCNKPDSPICQHPGDYTLFCIGEFDPDTGSLIPLGSPSSLGTGVEYQRQNDGN